MNKRLNIRELELLHARRVNLEKERQIQLQLPSKKRTKLKEIEANLNKVREWIAKAK